MDSATDSSSAVPRGKDKTLITRRMCLISLIVALGLALLPEGMYVLFALLLQCYFCGWDYRKWPKHPTGSDLCFPWKSPVTLRLSLGSVAALWLLVMLLWVIAKVLEKSYRRHCLTEQERPSPAYLFSPRNQTDSSASNGWDNSKDRVNETTPLIV